MAPQVWMASYFLTLEFVSLNFDDNGAVGVENLRLVRDMLRET